MLEVLSTGIFEVSDYILSQYFIQNDTKLSLSSFQEFQPVWILVMSIFWVSLKQSLHTFTPNSGRIIGLIHAACSVVIGFPVLFLLAENSFSYSSMFCSFNANFSSIMSTCNVMCYVSVGYFLMDSYFLVHKAYLKHHIGAILAWMAASYHHETSLVHGAIVIALFETGALLVQCSRMFSKVLWFRSFVCIGYTATRISLAWYYGFILYTCVVFWNDCSLLVQLTYVPIFAALLFLLALNTKWTVMQWKALHKAYVQKNNTIDFYTFHQEIIGNT